MNVERLRDRRFLETALVVFVFCAAAFRADASIFKSENDIQISNLHVIDDDFYAVAQNLTMDGTVEGDLLVIAGHATIRGEVTQSAVIVCQNLKFSGGVRGALRTAGRDLDVDGDVGRSVDIAGAIIRISRGANIERDVNAVGDKVYIDGQVGGRLFVKASEVFVTGIIDGDAEIEAKKIRISPPASISGNLTYTTPAQDSLVIDPGAAVGGQLLWQPRKEKEEEKSYTWLILRISSMLAAFIFGVVVVRLFRPYAAESVVQLRTRLAMSSAAGLVGLLGLLFCLVILVIALFFLIPGIALLSSESSLAGLGLLFLVFSSLMIPITTFGSVTGGIILYSGKIVVAFVLGFLIVRLFRPAARPLSAMSLFIGLVVLLLLFSLPYIGLVLYFLAMIIGAGAILLGIRYCRKDKHVPTSEVDAAGTEPPHQIQ